MQFARVVGTAVSSVKHPTMAGCKLLVVQPLASDRRKPDGDPLLAVDVLGAGRGDMVVISSDGRFVREALGKNTPVRYFVQGLPDS